MTAAVYARSHLDDLTRRQAHRALHTVRYWWQEAAAPPSSYRPRQCRLWARQALADAARLRRQLTALRALPHRHVSREQWAQITTRAANPRTHTTRRTRYCRRRRRPSAPRVLLHSPQRRRL